MKVDDPILQSITRDETRKLVTLRILERTEIPYGCNVDELSLHPSVISALKRRGIVKLYKFQEEAIRKILDGKDVVIVSGTGTGKTEAFLTPILQDCIHHIGEGTRALVMYPTKALARDQIEKVYRMFPSIFGVSIAIYDGDTSEKDREKIRANPPSILISNPDMLNRILPSKWFRDILSTLKIVVLDELHVYSGVFGAHVHHLLRRLRRKARRRLQFVGSSATIGNPEKFGKTLFDRDVEVISSKGRVTGKTYHTFIQPLTRSRISEAVELANIMTNAGKKTLIFVRGHKEAESIKRLANMRKIKMGIHRAGLTERFRKKIEAEFKRGELEAVVATPTLELGIDIGDLDCVILTEIPPTFAKYLQRVGRAGRRGQTAYVFTILGEDPISRYYSENPDEFFKQDPEPVYIDPTNPVVTRSHLIGMACDRPIRLDEVEKMGEREKEIVRELISQGYLVERAIRLYPTEKCWKSLYSVNLRGTGDIVHIYDVKRRYLGFREMPTAIKELFPGAIYMHGGKLYQVLEFDYKKATVTQIPQYLRLETKPIWRSEPVEFTPVKKGKVYSIPVTYGEMIIEHVVYGYKTRDFVTKHVMSETMLEDPLKYRFETRGIAFQLPMNPEWDLEDAASAAHASEHVIISAAQTVVGADSAEMGGISYPDGTIFIYDGAVGGSGLTLLLIERLEKALNIALKILTSCKCKGDGCPLCVYDYYCGNDNKFLSKTKAIELLRKVVKLKVETKTVTSPGVGEPIS